MPNSKHTPGPWRSERNEKSGMIVILGKRGDGNVRQSDGYGSLFSVDCATRETADAAMYPDFDVEAVANASLAVAAPDMLQALHLVGMSAGWQYLAFETRAIIEAAISKAEGRSNAQ